jgi:hypothetical protein
MTPHSSSVLSTVPPCNASTTTCMPVRYLDAAEAQRRNAVCLDGGPPALYYRNASSALASTKWVIYFKGGGWCGLGDEGAGAIGGAVDSCAHRLSTALGNSSLFPKTYGVDGPLDTDPSSNPMFHDYHHVVLWYCDGASFSGNREDPLSWPDFRRPGHNVSIHFRGRAVLDYQLDTLLASYGLDRATHVLLSGGSAGGCARRVRAHAHEHAHRRTDARSRAAHEAIDGPPPCVSSLCLLRCHTRAHRPRRVVACATPQPRHLPPRGSCGLAPSTVRGALWRCAHLRLLSSPRRSRRQISVRVPDARGVHTARLSRRSQCSVCRQQAANDALEVHCGERELRAQHDPVFYSAVDPRLGSPAAHME